MRSIFEKKTVIGFCIQTDLLPQIKQVDYQEIIYKRLQRNNY
jgi:hypothetical protein